MMNGHGKSDRPVVPAKSPNIRGFFDAIHHEWLVKFVEHRIADRRVVRLIQKWLKAGVLEDGTRTRSEEGTPQGGSATPPTRLLNSL
jgi:RNA-directed DNA polymerase